MFLMVLSIYFRNKTVPTYCSLHNIIDSLNGSVTSLEMSNEIK